MVVCYGSTYGPCTECWTVVLCYGPFTECCKLASFPTMHSLATRIASDQREYALWAKWNMVA